MWKLNKSAWIHSLLADQIRNRIQIRNSSPTKYVLRRFREGSVNKKGKQYWIFPGTKLLHLMQFLISLLWNGIVYPSPTKRIPFFLLWYFFCTSSLKKNYRTLVYYWGTLFHVCHKDVKFPFENIVTIYNIFPRKRFSDTLSHQYHVINYL